jgi:hypothetical protein
MWALHLHTSKRLCNSRLDIECKKSETFVITWKFYVALEIHKWIKLSAFKIKLGTIHWEIILFMPVDVRAAGACGAGPTARGFAVDSAIMQLANKGVSGEYLARHDENVSIRMQPHWLPFI